MAHQITLMNRDRIRRTIKRMAIQVCEGFLDTTPICIIGLNERGYSLAKEVHRELQSLNVSAPLELYAFDVFSNGTQPLPSVHEKQVLIVDDVIFSGRTLFQALSILFHAQEPQMIEVLALIDRGHRRYPILADITGEFIPTKFGEHVEVLITKGTIVEVVLFKNH